MEVIHSKLIYLSEMYYVSSCFPDVNEIYELVGNALLQKFAHYKIVAYVHNILLWDFKPLDGPNTAFTVYSFSDS